MTEATISYKPHIHQARVHKSTANNRVIVASRQSGKTVTAVAEMAEWAMSAPQRWPNDPNPQLWWCTATYDTKGKAWRDFDAHIPKEIVVKKSAREAYFELKNGSKIQFRSADGKDSLVSERLHGLVADEFCQYDPVVYHQLLAPMLATTGGPTIFTGTPRGHNWGYELYQNERKGIPGWASFSWSIYDTPYVNEDWIAQRKMETPDRLWRQEYLAEFMTDGGEVFRNVDVCIAPPAKPDDFVVIGLDLARTHDWTALMAFNGRAEWVDYRRVGHLDWSVQRIAVIEMYRRLKARKIVLDATGIQLGAEAVVWDLRQAGCIVESVHITGEIKRALIENLMLKFDTTSIRIPMEAAEEFRQYSVEQLPSGYDRYSAPSGKHDDAVMAAALGLWGNRHIYARPTEPQKSEMQIAIDRELRMASDGYIDEANW